MTRLFDRLLQLRSSFQRRQQSFASFFPSAVLSLLAGLLGGSLVGTFLDLPRAAGWWDGALILFVVLSAEVLTWWTKVLPSKTGARPLAFLKRGALFAFFVDAFKVGSSTLF